MGLLCMGEHFVFHVVGGLARGSEIAVKLQEVELLPARSLHDSDFMSFSYGLGIVGQFAGQFLSGAQSPATQSALPTGSLNRMVKYIPNGHLSSPN